MKLIKCISCGSSDLTEIDGYYICNYCRSKYKKKLSDGVGNGPGIAINEDVLRLLEKCRKEPTKAKRYANLILDIDPSNKDALKYL